MKQYYPISSLRLGNLLRRNKMTRLHVYLLTPILMGVLAITLVTVPTIVQACDSSHHHHQPTPIPPTPTNTPIPPTPTDAPKPTPTDTPKPTPTDTPIPLTPTDTPRPTGVPG